MIWYCTIISSHIVSQNIEGLLIRGISEITIFTVDAKDKWDASDKSYQKINENANRNT